MSNSYLAKRQQLSNQIRRQSIDEYRMQIRRQLLEEFNNFGDNIKLNSFSQQKLQQLANECQEQGFTIRKVNSYLQYISLSNLQSVANDKNINFMNRIIKKVTGNMNLVSYQTSEIQQLHKQMTMIINKIKYFLRKIIYKHLMIFQKTKDPNQKTILKGCFSSIINIIETNDNYLFSLWKQLSKCENQIISRHSALALDANVTSLKQLSIDCVSIYLQSYFNFSSYEVEIIQINTWMKYMSKLQKLLTNLEFGQEHIRLISKTLMNFLRQDNEIRVKILHEDFDIFPPVFDYLITTPQKLDDLSKIQLVSLIGLVFSTTQELSFSVFCKNQNILKAIRNCWPVPLLKQKYITNFNMQQSKNTKLQKNLVKFSMFSLSNIIATSSQILQPFLKSDMLLAFIQLFPKCPSQIKNQMCFVLHNAVLVSSTIHLQIMIENGIIDLIGSLIRDQISQQLQKKGVNILSLVCSRINDDISQNKQYIRALMMLKEAIIKIGLHSYIEGLLCSKQPSIAEDAEIIMKTLFD